MKKLLSHIVPKRGRSIDCIFWVAFSCSIERKRSLFEGADAPIPPFQSKLSEDSPLSSHFWMKGAKKGGRVGRTEAAAAAAAEALDPFEKGGGGFLYTE